MKTRQIPSGITPVVPSSIVYKILREQDKLRVEEREEFKREKKKMQSLICEIALILFKSRNLRNGQESVAANFYQALESSLLSAGVEIIDYQGRTVDAELQEKVRIEGWEQGELPEEVVGETFMPEIRWQGELLHIAQVFCLRAKEDQEEAEALQEKTEGPQEEGGECQKTEEKKEEEVKMMERQESSENREEEAEDPKDAGDEQSRTKEEEKASMPSEPQSPPLRWYQRLWRRIVRADLREMGERQDETETIRKDE